MTDIAQLAAWPSASKSALAFSGAGMSTESGALGGDPHDGCFSAVGVAV